VDGAAFLQCLSSSSIRRWRQNK